MKVLAVSCALLLAGILVAQIAILRELRVSRPLTVAEITTAPAEARRELLLRRLPLVRISGSVTVDTPLEVEVTNQPLEVEVAR